ELGADDQNARPRMVENVSVIGRLPQRVDRNGYSADLDRAKEAVRERRAVEQQEDDALLGPDAEPIAQRAAAPVDAVQKLPVRDTLIAAFDGDRRAAALEHVPVDEVSGSVEDFRDAEGGGVDGRRLAHPSQLALRAGA